MREILFRGKGIDCEWYEGCLRKATHEKPSRTTVTYNIQEFNFGYASEYDFDHTYTSGFDMMVYPETIGQFTGLTDVNGKRVFEGDIVKCRHNWRLQVYPNGQIPDVEKYFFEQKIRNAYGKYKEENPNWMGDNYYYFRNYVIEYYAPNGCFRVRNGGQFHNLTGSYISNRDLEVIGNIHDNPELLKGGAE